MGPLKVVGASMAAREQSQVNRKRKQSDEVQRGSRERSLDGAQGGSSERSLQVSTMDGSQGESSENNSRVPRMEEGDGDGLSSGLAKSWERDIRRLLRNQRREFEFKIAHLESVNQLTHKKMIELECNTAKLTSENKLQQSKIVALSDECKTLASEKEELVTELKNQMFALNGLVQGTHRKFFAHDALDGNTEGDVLLK